MNKKIYLLLAFFLLVPGIGTFAQTITRGPYLQSGTPNSMIIKWRTDVATSTRVWYGPNPSSLLFTATVNGTRTNHEVKVTGLAANSTYFYTVGNTTGQLVQPSASHYFRTSPTPGATQTIRAWVLGDCGTGDAKQRAVRDAFYNFNGAQHIDLMLLLGDNAYEDGTDLEFQAAFFENMYEDRLINTVMWPAIGNHETVTSDSPTQSGPYYDIFTMPTNGEAGGVPSGTEAYYSFDYGNIHFVVLDSDDSGRNPGDPQLVWLENDLSSTNQDWIVAYWHHPPYSKDGESDNNSKERKTRESFVPVLESHGVDLVLVGHSHNWQRSYLIHGHYGLSTTWDPATMGVDLGDGRLNGTGAYTKNAQGQGTVYIVSGSAGKKTGPIASPNPVMYRSQADYGSMYLEVTGGQMDIKFLRENGNIDDYLTIVKQVASGMPPSVSITAPADGTHYLAPQSINITANASDSDGSVTQVEFFVNNMSIGVDNQAPWSVNYWLPAEGNYNLTAVARDNQNNTAQSAMVHLSVGPVTTCARIATGSDDAEERPTGSVSVTNSDLELCNDPGVGDQIIGLRFTGLNIPPGAAITEARIRFTADENVNDNPCSLTIYGQASDNAAAFTTATRNVSSRLRTSASALWQPANWLAVGDAGTAQQTVDIAPVIQEIINRPGYSAGSAIALIIEGVGRRTAESYEGSAPKAAELCITYSLALPDCPALGANIGAPCDDGDNTTVNDVIDANCNCAGTPTACTG
ncbi:MAG: metallophosphoesterase, partial [Phaeodactylibacter sp.]|nr:metallophosphoesterase [Phaeodactylibacter sp.]